MEKKDHLTWIVAIVAIVAITSMVISSGSYSSSSQKSSASSSRAGFAGLPSNSCGDGFCDASINEDSSTCLQDCPPADTTPPVISNGQPTGTIPTPQTGVSVQTNEPATCKWTFNLDKSYDDPNMDVFPNTGNLQHDLGGRLDGFAPGQYTIYVKCQDQAGNINPTSYSWIFTVPQPVVPDFSISFTSNPPATEYVGFPFSAMATVTNYGASTAAIPTYGASGATFSGGTCIGKTSIFAAGEQCTLILNGTANVAGTHWISVDVDSVGNIPEVYEDNNNITTSVSIINPPDTPPTATITRPIPNENFQSGVTVPLYVTTNENANCRYNGFDATYNNMNAFPTAATTAHSVHLSSGGLGPKTIYVRCQDIAGNTMTTSASVTFNLINPTYPVISNHQPTGTNVPATHTISVQTNEAADCRLGINTDLPFSQMAYFLNNGGTSHSYTQTNSGTNTVYVKCVDAEGLVNPTSYSWTFTALPGPTYNLTLNLSGNGGVGLVPQGTSCGFNCYRYTQGSTVTLTATPSSGSNLSGWSGCDGVTGNICTVTMISHRNIYATFTDTTPPLISLQGIGLSPTSAQVDFSTNEQAIASVEYGTTAQLGLSTPNTVSGVWFSIGVPGLSPSITYHYRIKATDATGNVAYTTTQTFTTKSAPFDYTVSAAPPVTITQGGTATQTITITRTAGTAQQVTFNPQILTGAGVTAPVPGCTPTSGSCTMTVTYTATSSAPTGTTNPTWITATTGVPNKQGTFQLTVNTGDTTPPTVSTVKSVVLPGQGTNGQTAIDISWITNEFADSKVSYRPSTSSTWLTTYLAGSRTAHIVRLGVSSGIIIPDTLYYYTVSSADAAGNIGTSSQFSFTTDASPPSVLLTTPASNAFIRGTRTVSATASDNVGVTRVEFYSNNALLNTDTTSPYSFNWNTATVANGVYTLKAMAYDAVGNNNSSTRIVTVDNTAPTVSITAPLSGAQLGNAVTTIRASATDQFGIDKVMFYAESSRVLTNGSRSTVSLGTDTTSPYTISWNPYTTSGSGTYTPKGSRLVWAVAYDKAGNSMQSTKVAVAII